MTTPGEIAVVMVVLALIAVGSTVAWVYLFYSAARAEKREPPPRLPAADAARHH